MRVEIDQLRTVMNMLLDQLQESHGSSVDLDVDYYWWIDKDDLYDSYDRPTKLTIGQLSEDWEFLNGILAGRTDPLPFAFVWVGTILRAIGETVRP